MRTIVLVVRLAKLAFQTGTDLSANTDTVSNLHGCDLVADFDSLADNFMTDADWEWAVAPPAIDSMNIGAADTATLNFDINITILKLLRFKLGLCSAARRSGAGDLMAAHFFLLKLTPLALIFDHVALEGLRVRHYE